jgi:hypothetical protein
MSGIAATEEDGRQMETHRFQRSFLLISGEKIPKIGH